MTIAFAHLELVLGLFLERCPTHSKCQHSGRDYFSRKTRVLGQDHPELAGLVQELNQVNDDRNNLIHGVAVGFSEDDELFTFLNKTTGENKTYGTWEVQKARKTAQLLAFALRACASGRAKNAAVGVRAIS